MNEVTRTPLDIICVKSIVLLYFYPIVGHSNNSPSLLRRLLALILASILINHTQKFEWFLGFHKSIEKPIFHFL